MTVRDGCLRNNDLRIFKIKTFTFSEKLTIKTLTALDSATVASSDKSLIMIENWLVMKLQTYSSHNNNIVFITHQCNKKRTLRSENIQNSLEHRDWLIQLEIVNELSSSF